MAQRVFLQPADLRLRDADLTRDLHLRAALKKAGLVTSREGQRGGGYAFAEDPARVTLLQVLDALDERIVSAG